jgi:hypothetical protein
MPLHFDQLQPDDLPIDWPMILVGWHGFARRKLSVEQVIAHALGQIDKGTPEQDELAALLANADTSEWQTVDRYLEQLADTQQFDRQVALRKWRLAELKRLLRSLPRPDGTYEFPEDELLSVYYDLTDFWRSYDELPDSAAVMPQPMESVEEMLAAQRAWAEHEEAFLRSSAEVKK